MIYQSTPYDGVIPHRENIYAIHNSLPLIPSLDDLNPIYAGGYPMALLFAPRATSKLIKPGYYDDHDLYFRDRTTLAEAKKRLDRLASIYSTKYSETPNALTYIYRLPKNRTSFRVVKIQLIKLLIDKPQNIISKFDFINCCIGYTPLDNSIYIHNHTIKVHSEQTLSLLKPKLLHNPSDPITTDIIVQLVRIKKYCLRWEYIIDNNTYDFLMSLYKDHPNLTAQQNRTYFSTFAPYEGVRYITERNQNIWEAIAPIIRAHPRWSLSKDPHGIITRSILQPDFTPLVECDTQQESINRQIQTNIQALNTLPRGQDTDIPF